MKLSLLAAFLLSAGSQAASITFQDRLSKSGIQFRHADGATGKRSIVETVASGLAVIDYNGDGLLDIYFLSGLSASGNGSNQLYRNDGGWKFTDVTEESNAGFPGYSVGCAVADYDNDGDEDLFVTGYGRHWLMRNDGGKFSDQTQASGLASSCPSSDTVGAGCAFLDYDRDGLLDLYVGNYLRTGDEKGCTRAGVPVYCDPRIYTKGGGKLFRNSQGGIFEDVSERSGIARFPGFTMGVVSSDFNRDGWPDLFVGNDVMANFLFLNQTNGTFKEVGALAGSAYDMYGDEQGTMGVNAGDFNGDGLFDLFVTTYQNQPNTLYQNLGSSHGFLQFEDATTRTGAGLGSLPLVTWGCSFADFDNDGAPELFSAAGHLQDTIAQYDSSSSYKQTNTLLRLQNGRFVNVAAQAGAPFQIARSARGSVTADFNNDGLLDIAILNAREAPSLLANTTTQAGNWIKLKLIGSRSNKSAVGALVKLQAGGKTLVEEVRAGRSYQSAEDLRLHFGLGSASVAARVEVRWPSGLLQPLTNLPANKIHIIREPAGK